MTKVNQNLIAQLQKKLDISRRQVDRLISSKADELFLPRSQAAIVVATESGLGASRYASSEDLAAIRQAKGGNIPTIGSVSVPIIPKGVSGIKAKRSRPESHRRRGKSVFVVHGRNENLRRSLFQFLRAAGLNPIEWRKAIELTGKPSPFVAEILDAAFRHAVAVVVLLSPDDEAKLKNEYIRPQDPDYEKKLSGQARPNVLFEAGMAFGRSPDSTVLVQVGDVKPFSDVAGRHVVKLTNSAESRNELVVKLANAGCNVEISGSDWLREGDFGN